MNYHYFIYFTLYIENRQYDFPCKKAIGFPIAFMLIIQRYIGTFSLLLMLLDGILP